MNTTTVPTRDRLLEILPTEGRFCELGAFKGDFAFRMARICRPRELHLIDTWSGRAECGNQDGEDLEIVADMETVYAALRDVLANDPESRMVLHRGRTQDELARFPDGYFDFVYVDADHHEAAVYADLTLAHQKTSGLLGGHDYCPRFPGVMRAVDRFCAVQGLVITHLTQDGCPSYLLGAA